MFIMSTPINVNTPRFHPRDSDNVHRPDSHGIADGGGDCANLALAHGSRSGSSRNKLSKYFAIVDDALWCNTFPFKYNVISS